MYLLWFRCVLWVVFCYFFCFFFLFFFFFQAEDGIRDDLVTGVQTCALPILQIQCVNGALTNSSANVAYLECYRSSKQPSNAAWAVVSGTHTIVKPDCGHYDCLFTICSKSNWILQYLPHTQKVYTSTGLHHLRYFGSYSVKHTVCNCTLFDTFIAEGYQSC